MDDRWRKKRNVKVTVNGRTSPRAICIIATWSVIAQARSLFCQCLLLLSYLVKGSVDVEKTEHIDAQAKYIDSNHGHQRFDHIKPEFGHPEHP